MGTQIEILGLLAAIDARNAASVVLSTKPRPKVGVGIRNTTLLLATAAVAQDYPNRPVVIIVPAIDGIKKEWGEAAATLGATQASVLRYADSGDVSGDKSSVVGYMAAAIW